MFSKIKDYADDPIESLYLRSGADKREGVLNLGIGVYRDEHGHAPVFDCVQIAEQRLAEQNESKSYMTPMGNPEYIAATEKLIFGADHPVLKDKRIISAQCPGAGGGLRLGAELIKSLKPDASVWFSEPVWEHQIEFFSRAGLSTKHYRYYDPNSHKIEFDEMLDSMQTVQQGDLIIIHGCCHNPTGADLSLKQWRELTDFLLEKKAIPFVDIAYQGYGSGIEEDVAGMQYMASKMENMLVTLSSSKSFAVYRDRAGLVSVIHSASHPDRASLQRYVRDLIRGTYFMPPNHGAAVIAEILNDPELYQSWRAEIDKIRHRIARCRNALADALEKVDSNNSYEFLRQQKGMFSCLPLNSEQLAELEQEHRIYLLHSGRINFAAMTENHAERIAKSIYAVQ